MKLLPRPSRALAALALALGCAAAQAAPDCDSCQDLPRLYREMLEQEFLRAKFQTWISQAYYPLSIDAMQTQATSALTAAMQGNLYGVLAPPASDAGTAGAAAPSFGTVISGGSCQLVEYVPRPGQSPTTRPVTEQQIRQKLCKPLAEFTIEHENTHIKACAAAYKAGDKSVESVEWFVQSDAKAYDAGVRVLRDHIAALARKCQWAGSTNVRKPDNSMVVPTPEEIVTLTKNVKAKGNAMRRATQ